MTLVKELVSRGKETHPPYKKNFHTSVIDKVHEFIADKM